VGPMDEKFDAVIYLGHPLTFTYSPISPGLATDDKYIAMRATRVGYRRILFEERGVKAPAEIANWAAEFRSRSQQTRPILPRLWRTYIASGMAAALASLPKDSKEIPQGVEALNKLSEAVLKRGKIDDAITAANKNAELFPKSPEPYLVLGAAYSAKGDKAQAAVHYRHALRLDPGNKEATDALARPRY
jgi:Flp pilus assembly protein TadD